MTKEEKLQQISKEIEKCKTCKVGKSGKAVPGEGSCDAKIMFVGEAPGKTESLTGRPFVGRSGRFLRSQIQEVGLKDEDVYITSPVKYLPDRGTPSKSDIAHGRVHLLKQIEAINPKIIVLLGSVSIQGVLDQKIPVLKEHGKIIEKDDRLYFLTVHPAAGLRFPPLKKVFIEDFVKLKDSI